MTTTKRELMRVEKDLNEKIKELQNHLGITWRVREKSRNTLLVEKDKIQFIVFQTKDKEEKVICEIFHTMQDANTCSIKRGMEDLASELRGLYEMIFLERSVKEHEEAIGELHQYLVATGGSTVPIIIRSIRFASTEEEVEEAMAGTRNPVVYEIFKESAPKLIRDWENGN